ncbi:putative mannose-6-phosphate isomerase YvyI [Posidoniimonas polymericola]|uniref:Phosphohexomutase n=1 Tax=Posidoniimonas polymericola TaxID=2528002 RepID=A0A5C5YD35_9BACT|nr:type I phosphomannose isomerase catalytic subunit [Posidoniimonas polymericola]TWT73627.1 putative mannose-6-phosphate isomerase YvyI [Posidoniimonas polymericola]
MLPPLQFQPLFKRYLWGGRRLATVLGKPIGDESAAESWEAVDHGEDQSVVAGGPYDGWTLRKLVEEKNEELFGRHAPQEQFPLLFKYLDAQRTLSVQVHPNDAQGAKLDPPDLGKTEAWVVLAAEPGSKIYAGLNDGVDRAALAAAVEAGESDRCLHAFEAQPGDCVFISAGTVHALGAGIMIAEIQQASNTTFRLFDWNHVDKDGNSRPLHIEQSLEVSDYERGPVSPQTPEPLDGGGERLVDCDKFVLDRHALDRPTPIADEDCFKLISVISGEADLVCGSSRSPLEKGSTVLLPARREAAELHPRNAATVLEMRLP